MMIPTGAVIPEAMYVLDSTLGAVIGPVAGYVLLAALIALGFLVAAAFRPRARSAVRRIGSACAGAVATDTARRPAA